MEIQKMPEIWDDTPFWTSRNTVLGALANWAVQQSPYLVPDGLAEALVQFDKAFGFNEPVMHTNCKLLQQGVRAAFESCPQIMAWNNPRKGDHTIVFSSRYDKPYPDYDFIDLNALARNVAHSVTLAEKYRELHDSQIPQPSDEEPDDDEHEDVLPVE